MGTARGEFADRLPQAVEIRFTWRYRSHYIRERERFAARVQQLGYSGPFVDETHRKRIGNASAVPGVSKIEPLIWITTRKREREREREREILFAH